MTKLLPPEDVKALSVTEVTSQVRTLLEKHFKSVWVEGEISNVARPSSGHLYLTLKDADSQLRSVLYRGVGLRLRFDLKDGMKVVARGRISVYQPRGEYQFIIEELHPKGIGALELALLIRHAQWSQDREQDNRSAASARRFAQAGVDLIAG